LQTVVIGPPAQARANAVGRPWLQSVDPIALTTAPFDEVAMNQSDQTQREQDKPADDQPDITMTDAGEKEAGEDPDFDDTEIEDGDNRG